MFLLLLVMNVTMWQGTKKCLFSSETNVSHLWIKVFVIVVVCDKGPLQKFFFSSYAEVDDSLGMINCVHNKSLSACKWEKREEKNAFQKHFFLSLSHLELLQFCLATWQNCETAGGNFTNHFFGHWWMIGCFRNVNVFIIAWHSVKQTTKSDWRN